MFNHRSLIIFLISCATMAAKKEVNFVRFGNCPEYKNTIATFKDVFFKRNKVGKSISLRLNLVFRQEVKRLLVTASVRKCDDSANLDSCEFYMKDFKVKNVCDIAGKQNQFWSEAVSNSNFSTSCPIAAGTYSLNDTKLDGYIQLSLMTVPTAIWKIKIFAYDSGNNNVMVYCSDLELKVYHTRRNS